MLIKGRVVKVVEKTEQPDPKDTGHGRRNLQGQVCHHGGSAQAGRHPGDPGREEACRSS